MSSETKLPSVSAGLQGGLLSGLFDDASLFPPGSLPMPAATAALTEAGVTSLDLALVVTGGAPAVRAATEAVAADPRLSALSQHLSQH
ncbi:MAG TPA: hypothetical protein VNF47_01055 [Streptosporangiaceae bacterium]|nr:hypothetical protein [Streptosporangiaceae bacterium]